jgi:hypothetical protein
MAPGGRLPRGGGGAARLNVPPRARDLPWDHVARSPGPAYDGAGTGRENTAMQTVASILRNRVPQFQRPRAACSGLVVSVCGKDLACLARCVVPHTEGRRCCWAGSAGDWGRCRSVVGRVGDSAPVLVRWRFRHTDSAQARMPLDGTGEDSEHAK